jgi:hypothetical protein
MSSNQIFKDGVKSTHGEDDEPEATQQVPGRSVITISAWSFHGGRCAFLKGFFRRWEEPAKQDTAGTFSVARAQEFSKSRPSWRNSRLHTGPLLTSELSVDINNSTGVRNSRERVKNPQKRSYVVLFSVFSVTSVMTVLQEVVLGVGISGCKRENMPEVDCNDVELIFVTVPLTFRQVR